MFTPYLLQTRVNGAFANAMESDVLSFATRNLRTVYLCCNISNGKGGDCPALQLGHRFYQIYVVRRSYRPPFGKTPSIWPGKPYVHFIAFEDTTRLNQPAFAMRRRFSGACGSCLRLLRPGLLYTSMVRVPVILANVAS